MLAGNARVRLGIFQLAGHSFNREPPRLARWYPTRTGDVPGAADKTITGCAVRMPLIARLALHDDG